MQCEPLDDVEDEDGSIREFEGCHRFIVELDVAGVVQYCNRVGFAGGGEGECDRCGAEGHSFLFFEKESIRVLFVYGEKGWIVHCVLEE